MALRVLSISGKQPGWIESGWQHYARRLSPPYDLQLDALAVPRRGNRPDIARLKQQEAVALLGRLPDRSLAIAMDGGGKMLTTEQLAGRLGQWVSTGQPVCFMIGGPDGLHSDCLGAAQFTWSLGPLTLPHGLVRVVLAEQLYRAWSIQHNHPYHRA